MSGWSARRGGHTAESQDSRADNEFEAETSARPHAAGQRAPTGGAPPGRGTAVINSPRHVTDSDVIDLGELTESERDFIMDQQQLLKLQLRRQQDQLQWPGTVQSTNDDEQLDNDYDDVDDIVSSYCYSDDYNLDLEVEERLATDDLNVDDERLCLEDILRQCSEYIEVQSSGQPCRPLKYSSPTFSNCGLTTANSALAPPAAISPSSSSRGLNVTSGSSKIKTNGSLTSPVHGRRVVSDVTDATAAGGGKPGTMLTPCWLETTAGFWRRDQPPPCTPPPSAVAAVEERPRTSDRPSPGRVVTAAARCHGDSDDYGDVIIQSALQLLTGSSDSLSNDVTTAAAEMASHRRHVVRSPTQQNRTCRRLPQPTNMDKLRESRDLAKTQLRVLKGRLDDVMGLQKKALEELKSDLESVDETWKDELEELERCAHRLDVIKQQQMELLMESAREREQAENQLQGERHRLNSLERRYRETRHQLENDVSSSASDDTSLRSTLKLQQEQLDAQRRTMDDLEFQLLEMETHREEEREPFQTKLLHERTQLMQTTSDRKKSLQKLYEQKLELVSQTKADVTDLDKEYQLLVDAFEEEKQKVLNITKELQDAKYQQQQQKSTDDAIIDSRTSANDEFSATLDSVDPDILQCSTPPAGGALVWQTLLQLESLTLADRPWTNYSSRGRSDVISDDILSHVTRPNSDTDDSVFRNDVTSQSSDAATDSKLTNGDISKSNGEHNTTSEDFDDSAFLSNGSVTPANLSQTNGFIVEQIEPNNDRHNNNNSSSSNNGGIQTKLRQHKHNSDDSGTSPSKDIVLRSKRITQSRPLTRYLPVRNSSFNLRQFVESSGHSLEDSSSVVQLTSTTCQGALTKMARRGLHVWHRRWFLFDRARRTLSWHSSRPNSAAGGRGKHSVAFGDIVDVFVDHLRSVRSPSPQLTFCLKTNDYCYFLVAPTPEAMRIWIDVLVTGAEGYQEYW